MIRGDVFFVGRAKVRHRGIGDISMTTKSITKRENPKSQKAFNIYYSLGHERSLDKLVQTMTANDMKVARQTLAAWSKKYNWQERIHRMDDEAQAKAEEIAIKESAIARSKVLKMLKNSMILYAKQLERVSKGQNGMPMSVSDFKKLWEMWRVEEGKETGEPQKEEKLPQIIDNRTLIIIKEAENKLLEKTKDDIRFMQDDD